MKILALDQARNGGWSVFDYDTKAIVDYGTWSFPSNKCSFNEAIVKICETVIELIKKFDISAIFIEDIQLRQNVDSFKKLAMLQGALVAMFESNKYLYDIIAPSKWQGFCGARGRNSKEVKTKTVEPKLLKSGKAPSKVFSLQFVKDTFGIETENDDLADSCCIGYYVVHNIKIT